MMQECGTACRDVKTFSRIGVPANEIVRFAEEESVDLIVMEPRLDGFQTLDPGKYGRKRGTHRNVPVLTVKSPAANRNRTKDVMLPRVIGICRRRLNGCHPVSYGECQDFYPIRHRPVIARANPVAIPFAAHRGDCTSRNAASLHSWQCQLRLCRRTKILSSATATYTFQPA